MAERNGFDLMPGMATAPVNKYLPPRSGALRSEALGAPRLLQCDETPKKEAGHMARWVDKILSGGDV